MSNSSLAIYSMISPSRTQPRNHKIDTITVHCVVGQFTAKGICSLFSPPSRKASCNYAVGKDGSIALCVSEGDRSWCSGGDYSVNGISGKMNDHRAVTIEVASSTVHPYTITTAAMDALVRLVADIAKRNGMGKLTWQGDKFLVGHPEKQNMTAHRWFANKACPGQYLFERMGEIARRANEINYPSATTEKEDIEMNMTEKELHALMDKRIESRLAEERRSSYYNTLDDVPECYREVISRLMDCGAMQGYDGGADGLLATIGDNTIRVDETFCRVFAILAKPGAADALFVEARTYNTVEECPEWARAAVQWAVDRGDLHGDEAGLLRLNSFKLWSLQVDYNRATRKEEM